MNEREKLSKRAVRLEKSGKALQGSYSSCFINTSPDGSGYFCERSQLPNPAETQFCHFSDRAD